MKLLKLVFLVPLVAFIVALIEFGLISWSFKDKPWKMKIWIILSSFFWILWSAFTLLMRISDNHDLALLLLRVSFISLEIALYSAYRFHHLMVYKPIDNRFETFGLAILMGFNISISFNENFLRALKTPSGFYTDKFHPLLMIPNILFGIWAAFRTFKALNEMDAFSVFYDTSGSRNPLPIFGIGGLILAAVGTTVYWLLQARSDSTPFILIITVALVFFSITYGINPTSKVLAPQRIWSFLMINSSGLPIFEYDFTNKDTSSELSLFAMAITASDSIIRSNLKSGSNVNEISLKDRSVLISQNHNITFCIMADHRSVQLQIMLEETKKRIIQHQQFTEPKLGDLYGKYEYVKDIIDEVFSTIKINRKGRRLR